MLPVPEVSDLDVAFPAEALRWCPELKDIPEDHKSSAALNKQKTLWLDIFTDNLNAQKLELLPNVGVDPASAWRVIIATFNSFALKHEHKEACIRYFLSEWFLDFSYIRKDGTEVPWDIEFEEESDGSDNKERGEQEASSSSGASEGSEPR